MKYYPLSKDEEKLIDDFENDVFISTAEEEGKERYTGYAKASASKTRNINIRLSERDLQKIKARAAEKGIPYQTLVTSVLHQFSNR